MFDFQMIIQKTIKTEEPDGIQHGKQEMENNKSIITQNRNQLLKSGLIIILVSIALFLSSCAISNRLSIGDSRYLDLWWIQELSDNEVLAVYAADDNDNTIKIITYGERYSKWQRIKGDFTCVGFWTYETAVGEMRTIPVVVKTSEYETYKKLH